VLQALWAEQQKRNAYDQVAITYSGCLGPCDGGPSVLVYPEAVLYQSVAAADVAEIFESHLIGGEPVARLVAGAATW
jgi:(2Fe-2S) ferredoxin